MKTIPSNKLQFVIAHWIGHHGCKSWLPFKRYFRVSFSAPELHVFAKSLTRWLGCLDVFSVMSLIVSVRPNQCTPNPDGPPLGKCESLDVTWIGRHLEAVPTAPASSVWAWWYYSMTNGCSLPLCSLGFDVSWTIWLDSTVLMRILWNSSATLDAQLNLRWCVLHLLHPWHSSALHWGTLTHKFGK